MVITEAQMRLLKGAANSAYVVIKPLFLYHSNRLEGSTFSEEELSLLMFDGVVSGEHTLQDVIETRNSSDVFDLVVDTLGEPLSDEILFEMNRALFRGTEDERAGWTGRYKPLANMIRGSSVQLALPSEVKPGMDELRARWPGGPRTLEEIAAFHARFEHIHPFQNGNGRIGRFVMMKQCMEAGLDMVVVDAGLSRPYKAWLEVAQTKGDLRFLVETLRQCQDRFDVRMDAAGAKRGLPTPAQVETAAKDLGREGAARASRR